MDALCVSWLAVSCIVGYEFPRNCLHPLGFDRAFRCERPFISFFRLSSASRYGGHVLPTPPPLAFQQGKFYRCYFICSVLRRRPLGTGWAAGRICRPLPGCRNDLLLSIPRRQANYKHIPYGPFLRLRTARSSHIYFFRARIRCAPSSF